MADRKSESAPFGIQLHPSLAEVTNSFKGTSSASPSSRSPSNMGELPGRVGPSAQPERNGYLSGYIAIATLPYMSTSSLVDLNRRIECILEQRSQHEKTKKKAKGSVAVKTKQEKLKKGDGDDDWCLIAEPPTEDFEMVDGQEQKRRGDKRTEMPGQNSEQTMNTWIENMLREMQR